MVPNRTTAEIAVETKTLPDCTPEPFLRNSEFEPIPLQPNNEHTLDLLEGFSRRFLETRPLSTIVHSSFFSRSSCSACLKPCGRQMCFALANNARASSFLGVSENGLENQRQ